MLRVHPRRGRPADTILGRKVSLRRRGANDALRVQLLLLRRRLALEPLRGKRLAHLDLDLLQRTHAVRLIGAKAECHGLLLLAIRHRRRCGGLADGIEGRELHRCGLRVRRGRGRHGHVVVLERRLAAVHLGEQREGRLVVPQRVDRASWAMAGFCAISDWIKG